jgi:hypothetical protein
MEQAAEVVLAEVDRDALSGVLTHLHRGGFGHLTRVFDPERGDPRAQLRRAGVEPPLGFVLEAGRVAVMISAAARAATAAGLLERLETARVWLAARAPAETSFPVLTPAGRAKAIRDEPGPSLDD